MRKVWLGSSWKMHKTISEAQLYAQSLKHFVESENIPFQLFIIPPFTSLPKVCEVLRDTEVLVGAQNMHWEDSGPYTGEISPLMIKDCGAQVVELGHSERRESFGETDYTVNKKVLAALRHGLRPLVCVGETLLEKAYGIAQTSVTSQVRVALNDVSSNEVARVMFAYEPVWAIGESGLPAEPEHAETVQACIRKAVADLYGEDVAGQATILYGGSVNHQNAAHFLTQPNVDGLFIGRAAWEVSDFVQLVRLIMARSAYSSSPRPRPVSERTT